MLEIYQHKIPWLVLLSNHQMNCTGASLEADQDPLFQAISDLLSSPKPEFNRRLSGQTNLANAPMVVLTEAKKFKT